MEDFQRKENREWIKMEELKNKENIAALTWELKLCWREMKFCENQKTMEDYEKSMTHNIKKHNEMMQSNWDKIEYEIQLKKKKRLRSRNKNSPTNIVNVSCEDQSRTVDNENTRLCSITGLDHAKNILNKASEEVKFKGKDFTKDPKVFTHVFNEIKLIFDHVQKHVLNDVRKIINASKHSNKEALLKDRDSIVSFWILFALKIQNIFLQVKSKTSYKSSKGTMGTCGAELSRNVSFGNVVSIGKSDQILEKGILLKNTSDRVPTPTVS